MTTRSTTTTKNAAAGHVDRTTEAIAAALLQTARVITQARVHETLCRQAAVDLDRGGAALLYKLYTGGEGLRLTDLAERLDIDPPAVTRKVQQLERAGLVRRSSDPCDGRACRLALTDEGRASIEGLLHVRERWLAELLRDWPKDDRKEFARLLQQFALTIARDEERSDGR